MTGSPAGRNPVVVELGPAQFAFDPSQALDLRGLWLHGVDMSPGPGSGAGQPQPVGRGLEGLILTCGPDHIRQPCQLDGVSWPLHGSLSGCGAEDVQLSHAKPDRAVLEARVPVVAANGGRALLRRKYVLRLGPGYVRISVRDRLSAESGSDIRPMVMYHLNIDRRWTGLGTSLNETRIPSGDHRHCRPAPPALRLSGLQGPACQLSVVQCRATLPWFQSWGNDRMFCLEPASHPLVPRAHLTELGSLKTLLPDQVSETSISLQFSLRDR
jgi:hypothetical protein